MVHSLWADNKPGTSMTPKARAPKLGKIISRLKSRAGAMALGSLMFQGATFVMLMLHKSGLSAEGFTFIVVQIAWASILGSVATFRLELLFFQERGRVDRSSLMSVFAFSVMFLPLLAGAINGAMAFAGQPIHLALFAVVLALGLGLHEAQSFLCVQLQRVPQLLVTRFVQGAGILHAGFLGWSGSAYEWVFAMYALSVTVPLVIWMIYTTWQVEGEALLAFPHRSAWKRGLALAVSSLVNTLYTSAAVLVAAATQTPAFVADFGFIMRLLTGPITTIRQAFGHTYMAAAFAVDQAKLGAATSLWQLTWHSIRRSVSVYLVILTSVMAFLFTTADLFDLSRPQIIMWLSVATIAQVGVNTVAGIRTPLRLEKAFLGYDVVRTGVLLGVLMMPLGLPFDVVFAVTSSSLYCIYILFIRIQIFSLPR